MANDTQRPRFVESLPAHGPWTPLGLGRGQFLGILALSVLLFVFVDGSVWRHVHDGHLRRIATSYLAIPVAVGAALVWNRTFTWVRVFGATIVLSAIKFVLTAVLLGVLGMAG